MWNLGKLSCKWTDYPFISLTETPLWGEGGGNVGLGWRYHHCSFLNIISQVGLSSISSILAANRKIKGLCRVWSQRVEGSKWTLCSGFHVCLSISVSSNQSSKGMWAVICYMGTNWPFNSISDQCSLQWLWTSWVVMQCHCIKALCWGMAYSRPVKKSLWAPDRCAWEQWAMHWSHYLRQVFSMTRCLTEKKNKKKTPK